MKLRSPLRKRRLLKRIPPLEKLLILIKKKKMKKKKPLLMMKKILTLRKLPRRPLALTIKRNLVLIMTKKFRKKNKY